MDQSSIGISISALGILLFLIVGILMMKKQSNKAMGLGIGIALLGITAGAAGAFAGVKALGYSFYQPDDGGPGGDPGEDDGEDGGGGGGGGGRGGGGAGGGGGGGGRGGFQPSPSRDLTTLVKKLHLATGDIALNLDEDKATALVSILEGIKAKPAIEDADATDMIEEIKGRLSEGQLASLESFSLPRTRGSRGGGEGAEEGPTNPFSEEANASAMDELISKLAKK